jgi:hypothetical protein
MKCLESDFFSKMKKETVTDCSETVKQQIQTEELIKSEYEEFLTNLISDPE